MASRAWPEPEAWLVLLAEAISRGRPSLRRALVLDRRAPRHQDLDRATFAAPMPPR
jgi:hypothetical protein